MCTHPVIKWAEDYSSASLSFACDDNDGYVEVLEAYPRDGSLKSTTTATCDTPGVTTYVATFYFDYTDKNYKYTTKVDQAPLGHDMAYIDAVSPTCTEDGNKTYWQCSRCDTCFRDPLGALEAEVAAKGHDWEDDFTLDQESTCEEEGSRSIHCADCDAVRNGVTNLHIM